MTGLGRDPINDPQPGDTAWIDGEKIVVRWRTPRMVGVGLRGRPRHEYDSIRLSTWAKGATLAPPGSAGAGEWVPVHRGLPSPGEPVILRYDIGPVVGGEFDAMGNPVPHLRVLNGEITHWARMPADSK